MRQLALSIVKHHGAISTATALDRLGHHDLANRLIAWFASDADAHTKSVYAHVLAASGHKLPDLPTTQSLDDLLREVFALADELDRERLDA